MAGYRSVWILIVAVTLLQAGGGILGIITPLGLEYLGAAPVYIGAIGALHAGGFMYGARRAPTAIRTFGNIRVYAAAAAIVAISIMSMQLALDIWSWALIRLIQGFAFAMMFSSVESWLGAAVAKEDRGGVTGFYHLMAKIGLMSGPFFALGASVVDAEPFLWAAMFVAASMLPVCLTQREEPPLPGADPLTLPSLFKLAPAGVFAAFLAGVANTGVLALLPVYAIGELESLAETPTAVAAIAAAAAWLGGLVTQWPCGKLSDAIDRRWVIAGMSIASGGAAAVLGIVEAPSQTLSLILIGLWGAGALSFYGIAVAHIVDRSPDDKIAQAMSGTLFVWAFGSVLGPPLAGLAMSTNYGAKGLFVMAAIGSALLAVVMVLRRAARTGPDRKMRAPWNFTTPLLAQKGKADPRVKDRPDS